MALALVCAPKSSVPSASGTGCPQATPAGMACVPGGTYTLGTNNNDFKKELAELTAFPERKVELSAFFLDRYEITTAEYQLCVRQGKCSFTQSNYPQMRGEKQPQLKADWFQAAAYCEAQGKRLPTEAEFEAASRGPAGELYPWGNEPATCERAIIQEKAGRGCPSKKGEKGFIPTPEKFASTGNTWEVGSRPVGRYGLYDMAGNAQEWVSDWYVESLAQCGMACSDRNPQGPCAGAATCPQSKRKLVKGGAWYWGAMSALAAVRRPYEPKNDPPHHFGFRCAKSL